MANAGREGMMSATADPSASRSFPRSALLATAVAFVVAGLAEALARRLGFRPWAIPSPDHLIEPPGPYHVPDQELGYLPRPGRSVITLPGGFRFLLTHLENGSRITHPVTDPESTGRKRLWLFGCSFTQGMTLNDHETYPWLLQQRLSGYAVDNFGINGYSTVQSLLQFRRALEDLASPAVVVVAYGSFHDQRNTLTRSWMKLRMSAGQRAVARARGPISLPGMRFGPADELQLIYQPLRYRGGSLIRRSAIANTLDEAYATRLESSYRSHELSKAVLRLFAAECTAHGAAFVVAGIMDDPDTVEMLAYLEGLGIPTVDISVDLSVDENNNLPVDGHPSAIANQQYADRLLSFLGQRNLVGDETLSRLA